MVYMIELTVSNSTTYTAEFKEHTALFKEYRASLFFTSCIIHADQSMLINTYDMLMANDFIIQSPYRIRFYAVEYVYSCI